MPLRRHRFRRSRRFHRFATVLVLVGSLFVTARAARAAEPYESLAQIIARWREYVQRYRDVPREVRVKESKAFFATIPWENLEYLCREGSVGVGPDSTEVLQFLMLYRLEVAPPPPAEIAEMIASADHVIPCRSPLAGWVAGHRDSLSPADRQLLAAAELEALEFPGLPPMFEEQLNVGAVGLVASDSLMTTMMHWARSGDPARAGLGVRMLAFAVDSRAPDSLAALAREYQAQGSANLDQVLIHCRGRCGELALPVFIAAFEDSGATPARRVQALEATAWVRSSASAKAILDHYRDGGVIADSTFVAPEARRGDYYGLWLATRISEPRLAEWLVAGPDSAAELALALLDRGLRFGPADHDSLVVGALTTFAGRKTGPVAERALRVRERALHPPNTGHPKASAQPMPDTMPGADPPLEP
jgi:hypothetical protein